MSRKRPVDQDGENAATTAVSSKRRRPYTEQDSKLAKIYDNLAHEVGDVRIKAAKEIVLELGPGRNPSAETVKKSLTRLIRGLCSSRKAARVGFSIALTEVLRQLLLANSSTVLGLDLDVDGVIEMVMKYTQPEGKVVGQERKDHLLGRATGFAAIIQSAILYQPEVPIEAWGKYLDALFKLAREVSWLREECGKVLCDSVPILGRVRSSQQYLAMLLERLRSNGLAKTPEGVAIWLTIRTTAPDFELPEGVWHKKDPLCTKERQPLANVMRENYSSTTDQSTEGGNSIKSGSSQTTLNFAWNVVISNAIARQKKRKGDADDPSQSDFEKFWIDVVDNNLFSATASPERKSWGFQLFANVLTSAPERAIPAMFSPNLMRCLINQRIDSERYLHEAALGPLTAIRNRVKKQPELARVVIPRLISKYGSVNFDQITKTKTVDSLITIANDASMSQIVFLIHRLLLHPDTDELSTAETHRRMLADMLVSTVRSRNNDQASSFESRDLNSWISQLLSILANFAYFIPQDNSARPLVSEASRKMFQTRLSSCLAHILAAKLDGQMFLPYFVVSTIHNLSKSSKTLQPALQADKEILKALKRAHKTLDRIASDEEDSQEQKKAALRALKLLLSLSILQVYNGDADAVAVLEELDMCYESFTQDKTDGNAFDLLIEVVLGFMAKPSVLFRKLAEQVFRTFASDMTAESLQSMIDILVKKENLAGQQDLFDQADEGNDDDTIDVEDTSEVVMIDGAVDAAPDISSDAAPEQSDDEEDTSQESTSASDGESDAGPVTREDEDEDSEELARFDALLAETLGTSKANGTTEGQDESSDDEDMDDEQMMALEPHLTKIFQERRKTSSKKQDNKVAKETVINFKNRVLDLLLIYVKQQHANPLAMNLVLPLLRLIRTTSSQQIAGKAFNLLKQYFDACKGKGLPAPAEDGPIWVMLEEIHREAMRDASKVHANACSRSSLFLVKVLVVLDAGNYSRAVDVYSNTQKHWYCDPKSKVQPALFTEWISWSIATRKRKS